MPPLASSSSTAPPRAVVFEPQHLANTAWSYATLGIYDEPLLDAIASPCGAVPTEFDGQALSNTAFAFAALYPWNHRSPTSAVHIAAAGMLSRIATVPPLHPLLDVNAALL
eukprot:NODE_16845_length_974_cov_4.824085.p1 GENE.NODE_16845_length_974_cov_4.824085~~NODE_16845_length_974_cov_4.824085.p1  ORF type:complete len:111 (-),score=23.56 NODE_16845_length_974_cov_4.824085:84-416(-)